MPTDEMGRTSPAAPVVPPSISTPRRGGWGARTSSASSLEGWLLGLLRAASPFSLRPRALPTALDRRTDGLIPVHQHGPSCPCAPLAVQLNRVTSTAQTPSTVAESLLGRRGWRKPRPPARSLPGVALWGKSPRNPMLATAATNTTISYRDTKLNRRLLLLLLRRHD